MSEIPKEIELIAEKLYNLFWSTKGYWTTPTDPPEYRADGKHKHKTKAISETLTIEHYIKHLTSDTHGLTVSPLYDTDRVYFGAIDVDTYKWDEQKKLKILQKAIDLKLTPAESKSGGIHLYAFTNEKEGISAELMRDRLKCHRDELELPKDTEIFPKQDVRLEKEYGNGITIPFRSFANSKKLDFKTMGLSITTLNHQDWKITKTNPGQFNDNAKLKMFDEYWYKQFDDYHDPIQKAEDEADRQDITREKILQNIRKGAEHKDGGTFDNWVLLFVAKSVKAMESDYKILADLDRIREHSDKADDNNEYFKKKIYHCRKKFGIEDPDKFKKGMVKRLVYIIDEDRYFDIKKNKPYKPEVIDKVFAQFFKKPTCTNWLKQQSDKIEVENWIWNPPSYDPKNKVVEINELKYLNSYKPNNLKPEEGDIRLWNELIDYMFVGNKKHIKQFLDWLAYQVQNVGTKLRFAIIIYSKEFQVGKGSIWRVIEKLFGKHNTKEIDIEQALDHAKEYLRNSAIVCVDEMESSGTFGQKKTLLNALKRIITAGELGHRARYSDYTNVPTLTNYILFTNNKDALSLPKNEKRYSVYMHETPRLNQSWYDEFHQWIDNEQEAKLSSNKNFKDGAKYILNDLLLRDVSKFNPKSVAPETSFNGMMSDYGAHPLAQLLQTKYDGNFYPLKQDIVSTLGVYNYLKENKELGRFRTNDIANALEFIGGEKLEQVPIKFDNETKRMTLFIIRNQIKYRDMPKADIGTLYWSQNLETDNKLSPLTGNNLSDDIHKAVVGEDLVQDDVIPPKKINL